MDRLNTNPAMAGDDSKQHSVPVVAKDEAMSAVLHAIRQNIAEDLQVLDLAQAANMPASSFARWFRQEQRLSPMRWLWALRTILAAEIMAAAPATSVTAVAVHCGFTSVAHFSRRFRQLFQESPSNFQRHFVRRAGGTTLSQSWSDQEVFDRAVAKLAARADQPCLQRFE